MPAVNQLDPKLIEHILGIAKKRQHTTPVSQKAVINFLRKHAPDLHDPLDDFSWAVLDLFKRNKLKWEDIVPLEDTVIPKARFERQFDHPDLLRKMPPEEAARIHHSSHKEISMQELLQLTGVIASLRSYRKSSHKNRTAAEKDLASVVIRHPQFPNYILHGLRSDNRKWSLPGGHADQGEDPLQNARRELYEETGLDMEEEDLRWLINDLSEIKEDLYSITLFEADCPEELVLDPSKDPDAEFMAYRFLDPRNMADEAMHVPRNRSILVRFLDRETPTLEGAPADEHED